MQIKRRDFIKTSAAGSAAFATSELFVFNQAISKEVNSSKYCFQSEREIPIAYKVDVVV